MTMASDRAFAAAARGGRLPAPRSDDASSPYVWIEALLARYPDISPAELDELVAWFEREASAQEVAMIASNPRVERGYRRFREERIDPLTLRDLRNAVVFVLAFALAVLGVIWLAP